MCDHAKICQTENHIVCTECGLALRPAIDINEVTYDTIHKRRKEESYSRRDRFFRLFCNLRGWQVVKTELVERIAAQGPFKTVAALRRFLKKHEKKDLNKLPTIWRSLGKRFEPPSEQDFRMAMWEFMKISAKKSFILILPYILEKIGRADLCKFCKRPTKLLQKKYSVYINEENWDETGSLVGKSQGDSFRIDQGQIDAQQTQ